MHHRSFRLKPTLNFYQNRLRLWIGLFCGVSIGVVVLYFQLLLLQANVYLARETHNVFIEVPAPQLLWSKCFFAAVAFLWGSSIAFLIWLSKPSATPKSRRFWLFMARNDQANLLPSFFHIYIKLVFVIFLWFLSFNWLDTSNTDLPDIVKVFAVLLPIVLLLNQWINVRRLFKVKVYWLGAHLLLLCTVSFVGTFVPLPMEGYLRQLFEEKRPYINLNIQYPDVVCDDFSKQDYDTWLLAGDLYMGFEGGDTAASVISIYQADSNWLRSGLASISRDQVIRLAHFDKRLPMSQVDSFVLNYRRGQLYTMHMHKMLFMYNCNNDPDYASIKPYHFLPFYFRGCDSTYFADFEWQEHQLLKVWANGNWTLNDKPYSDELLWETIDTNQRSIVMITYEPEVKLQQVLDAYNYLDRLGRPYTWQEYNSSNETKRELPDRKFYLTIWFLSGQACLE